MTDVIQLLPDSVANQIAAGEVIQRPASVVKELVENAIDAGATKVTIRIVDAGRTAIQVTDDGRGMTVTDARLAFERHSTSKIRQADDLFALHTMGFRGEALASIAAVAQVELKTCTAADKLGTRLCIAASRVTRQEPLACPPGSSFTVENLFFNVPARRKFLKSNTTELRNIIETYERIVLVYPKVAFSLVSNDVVLSDLRPATTPQRIADVMGRDYTQELLPMTVDTSLCRMQGFLGRPAAARRRGARQLFFVNGRFMRHALFNKAVQTVYERLVPPAHQVPYLIYIDIDPADIDVNIHPTKTEIKFDNEQTIALLLAAAVRQTVGQFCQVTAIDFDTQGRPTMPLYHDTPDDRPLPMPPDNGLSTSYNPFVAAPRPTPRPARPSSAQSGSVQSGSALPSSAQSGLDRPRPAAAQPSLAPPPDDTPPAHYQYKGRYIMTAVKSGLMVIDQHRAHLRILYDDYLLRTAHRPAPTQRLLFPDDVTLDAAQQAALTAMLPQLRQMGFDIVTTAHGATVRGLPAELDSVDCQRLLGELTTAADGPTAAAHDISHTVALCMARHTAIAYGQTLTNDAMDSLVNRLFACREAAHTPDGHNIITILPQQQIERLLD